MKQALAGIKPNISKIKDTIKTLNLKKASSLLKRIDKIYALQGLSVAMGIYLLIFGFVYLTSENTIKKITDKTPSYTAKLEYTESLNAKEKSKSKNKDESLSGLIIKGLYEKTAQGLLPVIRKTDSLTSFRAYQHPYDLKNFPQKPIITLVLNDYGLSKKQSETALDILPPEVSFILNPNADRPNEWIKKAQNKGHEVWLNLPIQNEIMMDQGPNTIFHHISLPEKIAALFRIMTTTQGYTGLAAFTDTQTLTEEEHYKKLLDEVYKRGLGFLETNPNAPALLHGKAITMGAPYIKTDTAILNMAGNKHSFEALEAMANKNGHVTAIIPPYPQTIKKLAVWLEKVGKIDYAIAPTSVIYDIPYYKPDMSTEAPPKTLKESDHAEPEHHENKH